MKDTAKKPILVIMAAGMGSRFGGLKQIEAVGPAGEAILDYSLFDAHRAGFETVVFIIKHAIEDAFKSTVGARAEKADGLRARGRHILGANARYCAGADRTDECAVHDGNGYLGLGIVQRDHGRAARQAVLERILRTAADPT